MKMIKVIKSRWNSDDADKFSSFQEALAYDLKNDGVVEDNLFWLGAHIWNLENLLSMIPDYDFLNSRTKKILNGPADSDTVQLEFEDLLNDCFYWVYEDLDLGGAQSDNLPDDIMKFKTAINKFHKIIGLDIKDLKKSISNIPAYGSQVFKTKVINSIENFEEAIMDILNKYINYFNKEYDMVDTEYN